MIEKLSQTIDQKLNTGGIEAKKDDDMAINHEKVDDSLIEKYLERYSSLLIKRIEEKINK